MLDSEVRYFEEHCAEWARYHCGKFALVKGDNLVGVFDTREAALAEGVRRFGLTPFLVRSVSKSTEDIHIPALALGVLRADPPRSV